MAYFTARIPCGSLGLRGFSLSASSSNGVPPRVDTTRQAGAGGGPVILELPLDKIRRPLMRTRANDPNKVLELMDSIRLIGLQVPIDVLEVDGIYYAFGGLNFDELLYFLVPQASLAVIGTKLISALASLPSVAKFAREQRRL